MDSCTAFVLMPFHSEFDPVYSGFIKPALEAAGFSVSRADDIENSREVILDVVSGILDADVVVADLTGANPNVYYELGIAHAVGAKVIVLTQEIDSLPFDIQGYRAISYSTHFNEISEARDRLTSRARGAITGQSVFGSPLVAASGDHPKLWREIEERLTSVPSCARGQHSTTTVELGQNEEEAGFLDVLADAEEALPRITDLFQQVVPVITQVGDDAGRFAAQMSRETPSGARRMVRTFSQLLSQKTDQVEQLNNEFGPLFDQMADWVDFLTARLRDPEADVGDAAELQNAHEQFRSAATAGLGAAESVNELAQSALTMTGAERSLNREAKRFHREISRQEGFILQLSALFSRLAEAIEDR